MVGDFYRWSWRKVPILEWGDTSPFRDRLCRLLAVGGRNMVLVDFDGVKIITDRRGLRKHPKAG